MLPDTSFIFPKLPMVSLQHGHESMGHVCPTVRTILYVDSRPSGLLSTCEQLRFSWPAWAAFSSLAVQLISGTIPRPVAQQATQKPAISMTPLPPQRVQHSHLLGYFTLLP